MATDKPSADDAPAKALSVQLPPNIIEFNQMSGVVLSKLFKEFPTPLSLKPDEIATAFGFKNGNDKLPSGRTVAAIMHHTCDRLTTARFIETIREMGMDGSRSCVLAERGYGMMTKPLLASSSRPAGTDISEAAKPENVSTSAGKSKLVDLMATFFGRAAGEFTKTVTGGG
jgi:hypothetical protein